MMLTIEALQAKIGSVEDLRSVVRTMKSLAAASIRQYERAVASLADYNRTIEMGLQVLLRERYFTDKLAPLPLVAPRRPEPQGCLGAIIVGSDRGLCGQFNEEVLTYALAAMERIQEDPQKRAIAAVGARLVAGLEAGGQAIAAQFSVPSSANGITALVQEILLYIEQWQVARRPIEQVVLFYNQPLSNAACRPKELRLLPLDADWLSCLEQRPWESEAGVLPAFTMDWQRLFSKLIRQYVFVSLYRTFAESLASENASRLTAMQTAEKNIEDRLSELNAQYRHLRQSSITEELLDIVAGFEALTTEFGVRS